jgi:hypothetical protein
MSTTTNTNNNKTNTKKGAKKAVNNHYSQNPLETTQANPIINQNDTKWKRMPATKTVVNGSCANGASADAPVEPAAITAPAAPAAPAAPEVLAEPATDVSSVASVAPVAGPVAAQLDKLLEATSITSNTDQSRMFDMLVSIIGNQQRMLETIQQQQQQQQQSPFNSFQFPQMVMMPTTPPMPPIIKQSFANTQQVKFNPPVPRAQPAATAVSAAPVESASATVEKKDDTPAEFAPMDLILEADCAAGFNCPNSKNPEKCPKNHHHLGNVIKKGAKLPRFFCKWERPWKSGPNGKPMRCNNPKCFNAHLDKRREFLQRFQQKSS